MDSSKKGLTKAMRSGDSIMRAESREPRAESREPRAESREPRAESREPRAESREPRAESREPRAESREPRAESREPRAESREPRAESREPRVQTLAMRLNHSHHGRLRAVLIFAAFLLLRQKRLCAGQRGDGPGGARGALQRDRRLPKMLQYHRIAAVAHGFRSSFRDWAAEETDHPREVIEAALAHVVQNKVEAAYARSDLFERRRRLMEDWAAYVVP